MRVGSSSGDGGGKEEEEVPSIPPKPGKWGVETTCSVVPIETVMHVGVLLDLLWVFLLFSIP